MSTPRPFCSLLRLRHLVLLLGLSLLGLGLPAASASQEAEPGMDEVIRALLQSKRHLGTAFEQNTLHTAKKLRETTTEIEQVWLQLYPPPVPPDLSIVSITAQRAKIHLSPRNGSRAFSRRVSVGSVIEGWTVIDLNFTESTLTLESEEGERHLVSR